MKTSIFLCNIFIILFFLNHDFSEPASQDDDDQKSGKLFLKIDRVYTPENVVWVEAFLTRKGFAPVSGTMKLLSDSTADLLLENIQAGEWYFIVNAKDSEEVLLYKVEAYVQIQAGFTTQLNLELGPTENNVGNVYILVMWGTTSLFGKAIDFDGNGDYANTFNNPFFPATNGKIEAWVKLRSLIPSANTFDIGDTFIAKNEEQWNNGDFYAFFEYSDRRSKSRAQKSPPIEVDVISDNNFWQSLDQCIHYAFTWCAGGMKMYINGVLQNNQNSFNYSALNNDYNFYVGARGYKLYSGQYVITDFFDGRTDELRIWNYQKSADQISALMNSPLSSHYYTTTDSGLIGYWRFDHLEDLGVNNDGPDDVRDLSVNHNHLDLIGNAHLVQFSRNN